MTELVKITGLEKVMKKYGKAVRKIQGHTVQGVLMAGLEVKDSSMKNAPVDTSNLRASTYVVAGGPKEGARRTGTVGERGGKFQSSGIRTKKVLPATLSKLKSDHTTIRGGMLSKVRKSKEPIAAIGFTAFYAVYVHEIKKKYNEGGHKFLERAVKQNQKRLLNLIKKEAAKGL